MGVGPKNYPNASRFGTGHDLVDRIVFNVVQVVGSILSLLRSSAVASLQAVQMETLHTNPDTPLTAAEVAVALVKNAYDPGELEDEAKYSGISPERLEVMRKLTGNPPGPEALVDQWRRGLIDDAMFVHGLRSGYLHDEWVGFFRNLRHIPLSPAQYLQGAVEGHIGLDAAVTKVDGLGVDHDDAMLVYETLGNPPGIVEMLHLWKRGFITEAEVDQAIRESHYKNKYLDAIKHYADYFPPPRTITTLLAHGAITQDQANKLFEQAGLSPELAKAYTASALHVATQSHKELTVSQVGQLYADHIITRAQALTDLARVGYAAAAADLLLDLADAKAAQKVRAEAINGVRRVYLAHRIDDATAQSDLAKFGVDPGQAASLLELWQLERLTPSKSLTIGQLNQAVKKAIITPADFLLRAEQLGYTQTDAQVLLAIDVPPATP